ncbi:MAG: fibrobacter succinogenes major paralogous domain-containing protein [Bacteroidales bacterium]|nr:fibrobacter succinogenes major paralogous domain-containing protein [Bacteroidales bacterium]
MYLPEKEYIKITVRDIVGKELAQYENTLNRGNHSFAFYSCNEKYYLLTVTGKQTSKTIKMLNANSNTTFGWKCRIVYNEYVDNVIGFKSQKAITNFVFNSEDELQYTGYANTIDGILGSDVIADAPQTSTNYEFAIIKGLRCPGIPTVTDIDGNLYNTVLIGSQCWMAENLKTTTYSNNTPIPNVTDANAWQNLITGAYVWYDNDTSWKDLYGGLYNWYAAVDPNGLCPTGWHVPEHDEWTILTDFIGGTGSPHGNKLKSCRQVNSPLGGECNTSDHPRWDPDNTHYGTDDYGFSGLPGGYRDYDGTFYDVGRFGNWWSSTEHISETIWGRSLAFGSGSVYVSLHNKLFGFSVRCLRD